MNKIIIIIAIILVLVIGVAAAVVMSPLGGLITSTVASKVAPAVQAHGTGCGEDIECVTTLAKECEVGNSEFSEDGIEGLMQIIAKEERGCKVYIRIDKHPDIPEVLGSLDATCWFAPDEVDDLDPATIDVATLDCEGPLYEAAKTTK